MCDVFLLGRTWPRCEAREELVQSQAIVHPSGDACAWRWALERRDELHERGCQVHRFLMKLKRTFSGILMWLASPLAAETKTMCSVGPPLLFFDETCEGNLWNLSTICVYSSTHSQERFQSVSSDPVWPGGNPRFLFTF